MDKPKGLVNYHFRFLILAAAVAAIIYLMIRNINTFGHWLIVVIGFGAVILIHEFGHFVVAKLAGIKVEAFSIGFPPIFVGILKTEKGWRIRILPELFPKPNDEKEDGLLSFTVGSKAKAGETEYRIGLIPFGGFVKMLGQEDVKTAEATDDPRSYANKPVSSRMAVIAAGVTFNAISAIIAFMVVFLIGINRPPAIIGGAVPGSPAALAGLANGDEIIAIGDRRDNLEWSDISMAAALSGRNEPVTLTVKHPNESVDEVSLVAKRTLSEMGDLRLFGVIPASSLTVANVSGSNTLFEKTGLKSGDRIIGVDDKDVKAHWELEQEIRNLLVDSVTVTAERADAAGETEVIKTRIPLELKVADNMEVESESDLNHIYSMVPRLKITAVIDEQPDKETNDTAPASQDAKLLAGDIILAVAEVQNPTFKELRDAAIAHENKKLAVTVLRQADGEGKTLTINVVPKKMDDRVLIGIAVALDAEHAIVAGTIAVESGSEKLNIPRGATITAVDGVAISSFYDCIREIRKNAGQRITIDYRVDEAIAGDVAISIDNIENSITVKSSLGEVVPFDVLEKLYKADGPLEAIQMGYRRTIMFIAQAYVTLQRAVTGLVSPKNFMGPVGIIAVSYKIVSERPLIDYVHLLGLISAFIAVFNFLPLLPFDGGHIVFLAAEKIKGSPVGERIQGAVSYIGLGLVAALFLYVTFNDVIRSFFQ